MMRFPSPNVSFCEEIQEWVLSLEPGLAHSSGIFLHYARSTKEPIMFAFLLAQQWFFREFDLSTFFCIAAVIVLCDQHYIIALVRILRCLQHCDGIFVSAIGYCFQQDLYLSTTLVYGSTTQRNSAKSTDRAACVEYKFLFK